MRQEEEDELLRSVAMQNATSILLARQRAEQELIRAKEALELKTRELLQSLAITRATLEATTNGILVTDEGGRVTDFNANYLRMWRLTREDLSPMDHRRLLEQISCQFADPQPFLDRIDEIYALAPPESFDVLELADGRIFERYSSVQFTADRDVGRVWSFGDITERRRAEEALRDETRVLELLNRTGATLSSQLDLQALVQAVTDAATELSGAQFGAFFYNTTGEAGDAFVLSSLSGAPRESFEKLGPPRVTALLAPTFNGEHIVRCDDVLTDPRFGRSNPHRGMPKGHPAVRSYLAVPVMSPHGEVIGSLFFGHADTGMFSTRTERLIAGVAAQAAIAIDNARLYEAAQRAALERTQLLESERSARSEAEHASAMKDDFLATLSHELRTPLSAILGWSQVLRRQFKEQPQLQQGLETIERNARVQTQLIEDLLDMSRITSGKLRLDIQPLEPITFIEAAIETVRPAAESKGIRIETRVDSAAGAISGDPARLQQVVWNLLSNAIKFTPNEGKVQVTLERVGSHVQITVADSGIGIQPEFLSHVFERFRQADASTTRNFGGLGLGLSIVKHLVELHGGSVHVKSPGTGQGTTFTLRLPLNAVREGLISTGERLNKTGLSAGAMDFEVTDLSGVIVLVVDDDADARELLKRVLGECDAEVLTAASGAQALALVQTRKPDVLVSDIGMPDMDGYELLRRIRRLGAARGGGVPAIALTAFARSEDRTRALRQGFVVHVSKPVEPSELIATVASVAGRVRLGGAD